MVTLSRKTNTRETLSLILLIQNEIIAMLSRHDLQKLNVGIDMKSFVEVGCLQNYWPPFLIHIFYPQANLEFETVHIFQNMDWNSKMSATNQWLSKVKSGLQM